MSHCSRHSSLKKCRILLHRLMRLCTRVLNYTEQNLMTVNNLSIVLGPSILYELDCDEFSMVCISSQPFSYDRFKASRGQTKLSLLWSTHMNSSSKTSRFLPQNPANLTVLLIATHSKNRRQTPDWLFLKTLRNPITSHWHSYLSCPPT